MFKDEDLISSYIEGDENALSTLVSRYLDDVYNFLYRLTGDLQIAEDATQESFIKVWKNIGKYKRGNNFKSWLFRIARNTAIDHLRKKKEINLSAFEDADAKNILTHNLIDTEPNALDLIQRAEDIDYVQKLLSQIDPKYREVLMLRESRDLTFEEIGKILGRPANTIKSQYRRAIASLRRLALSL